MAVVVKTVLGFHFGGLVNSPPVIEAILVVGLVDVHWGATDLAFDPWPFLASSWLQADMYHFR